MQLAALAGDWPTNRASVGSGPLYPDSIGVVAAEVVAGQKRVAH